MNDGKAADVAKNIASLGTGTAPERAAAAESLCRAGSDAAPAAVPLVRACGDDDADVREWAVAALEELGPPPRADVATLASLAAADNPLVSYWAITLLGRLGTLLGRSGPDASAAVAALSARLESGGDPAAVERAAWALGKIGPAAGRGRGPLERA
ncbi:MAG: hypothetical protein EBZ59_07135, partial [Planctomycetia bacterium]|nr:hypothetical protein [Planctomycetia bacterium]